MVVADAISFAYAGAFYDDSLAQGFFGSGDEDSEGDRADASGPSAGEGVSICGVGESSRHAADDDGVVGVVVHVR